jgi:hypothetical protein
MAVQHVVDLMGSLAGSAIWPILLAAADEGADKAEPWLKRLDPVLRTKVIMTLTGLLLLGALLIAIAMLWARHTRRKIREPLPEARIREDEWYNKPLVPKPSDEDADASA